MKRSKVIWVMGELFCKFMYPFNVKVSFSEEIIVTLHSPVHSVYGSLSVKLVMQVENPGWRNIKDVLDLLPGQSFEDTQQVVGQGLARDRVGEKKVVMVFFSGGITMAPWSS